MDIRISERLKELRRENNLTQEKLAEYLNISAQAVSKWENGLAYPDITLVPEIARLFGVTTDTLLGLGDSNEAASRLKLIDFVNSENKPFTILPVFNIISAMADRKSLILTSEEKASLTPFADHLKEIAEIGRTTGLLGIKRAGETEGDQFLKKAINIMLTLSDDGQELKYTIDQFIEIMSIRILLTDTPAAETVKRILSVLVLYLVYQGGVHMVDEITASVLGRE